MKKVIFPSLVLSALLFSCKKDSQETPPPIPDPGPIRVLQSITTREIGEELVTDTTIYAYDDEGRVTSKIFAKGEMTERYAYTNDKLTSIKFTGQNGTSESLNEAVYSASGDTVLLDFIQNGGSTDTVQLTYIFENNRHTNFWTYLHFADDCNCGSERHLQKEKLYYNGEGNVVKKTMQTLLDAEESVQYTVSQWDDKKNPKADQPKLNALFLQTTAPLESSSVHNPVKYTDGINTFEVEMTYNSEGYPLTYKLKGKDYVATQLVYNR